MFDEEELSRLIEAERQRFEVPGVAVAVVADGEVVMARGFGQRDLENDLPVTGASLFPIASDTKCFTAALVAGLVDDGLLDLDRPVQDYIPWFRMYDPIATALVSARDLLAHRTGLPRHDFVWYGPTIDQSNEEIARLLRHLPPTRQVREQWQYNNLCYSTAGYLAEHLLGIGWEEAVQQRILDPLGMKSTVFRADEASTSVDYAWPYEDRTGAFVRAEVPQGRGKPSGGIVSNAEDMARWALARLGIEVDGTKVLSDATLQEIHTPAMVGRAGSPLSGERQSMGYGLGTQVESYRGHALVRHGGNLVGYSSDVCVAPDAKAAVVVLTNLHGTALRDALPMLVFDRLMGLEPIEWGEKLHATMTTAKAGQRAANQHHAEGGRGRPSARPLDELAGTYEHPAYGTFTIEVDGEVDGGGLVPRFHGIPDLSLTHRDLEAWDLTVAVFEVTVPLIFQTGPDGEVASLTAAIEPSGAPIPFTRVIATPPRAALEKLVGAYAMESMTVEFALHPTSDTLVATLPSVGRSVLLPRGGLVFGLEASPAARIEFETDGDATPTRVVIDPLGIFVPQ